MPADTAVMRKIDDGTKAGKLVPVSGHSRRLARTIYLGITFRHRWPRFQRLAMRFDDRAGFGQDGAKAWLEPAHPGGLFAWWLHLKTKTMETPVLLPIRGWGRDRGDPSSTFVGQVSCIRRVPGSGIQGVGSRSGWISAQSV